MHGAIGMLHLVWFVEEDVLFGFDYYAYQCRKWNVYLVVSMQ